MLLRMITRGHLQASSIPDNAYCGCKNGSGGQIVLTCRSHACFCRNALHDHDSDCIPFISNKKETEENRKVERDRIGMNGRRGI